MKLPESLDGLDLGETPIGMLRTAGVCPFHDDAGEVVSEPIWLVLCPTRAWLAAAGSLGQWSLASNELRLEKGWTWDALVVGQWSAPLRKGTRASAESLMAKWEAAIKGGRDVPPPTPVLAEERAPAARGADGVPDWLPTAVPADPAEHWLFAFESARDHSFIGRDGQIHTAPTWFAVSDGRMVVAAQGPQYTLVREITAARLLARSGRRDLVIADGWRLPGALVGDRRTGLAGELIGVEGKARWAETIRQAIDEGDFERARALISEAFVLDRHDTAWSWIGLLALETHPDAALGAAVRAMGEDPEASALAWTTRTKAVLGSGGLPAGVLSECGIPELPAGLPWPPESPFEVWGTAAFLLDRIDEGVALWSHEGETPRALAAMAAAAVQQGREDAWMVWDKAADKWRATDAESARDALDRAILLKDGPDLRWKAASWAKEDDGDPIPHWEAVLPETPPEGFTQGLPAWRALAEHAETREAWKTAAMSWAAVRVLSPADHAVLEREARILENELSDLDGALARWRELAQAVELVPEPVPPRWTVWTEIARLAIALSALGEAELALTEAIRGDFLVPEAFQRVLELAEEIDSPNKAWWTHIHALLTSQPPTPARPPELRLADDALDALHPGGVGWLERARHSLDTSDPPPRGDLIRGLERITDVRWPALYARIDAIAAAVDIPAPETYLFRGESAWGLSAWPTEPPLVLVGHDHLDEAHAQFLSRGALHFALAVEIVHLAEKHPLLAFEGGIVGTSKSVYRAFGKYAGAAETVVDVVTLLPGVDQLSKIQTLVKLSKRVFTARSAFDKVSGAADSAGDLLGWSNDESRSVARTFHGAAIQFRLQADRAALLLTGDLWAALEAILKGDPELSALHATMMSEGLLTVLPLLDPDTRLRIAGLLEFAAGLGASDS